MKKLKNQNFDVNELKKRICNVIKSKPACFHKFCKIVKLEDFILIIYKGVVKNLIFLT